MAWVLMRVWPGQAPFCQSHFLCSLCGFYHLAPLFRFAVPWASRSSLSRTTINQRALSLLMRTTLTRLLCHF
ncbi:hypothetical protein I79_007053 [Cricetulus griseus]|uniref:Uncharacterized protein n=1 Tax=Cricetulus griseus TaxID=10029 RepID=G3H9I0_CRIGR|nr:hypothetical protein I79_007053 [Cricetulus griseus]